ncbi:hypothetical protein L2E82_38831 [Cichorium intybus]|uniref:Uncharacterized protein n=2 Tax=Cichorium intybus TaxID=13427 RepID=A0ACB9AG10_CICIN|nr:hypothetical protein L2E82_43969 [Cichorium intybus]KAI3709082.1 hypothetical protein L2E82_38831 [Cichorium intybus]
MIIKSKLKWVGLVGLVLSALSLFTHFLLARYSYTNDSITEYQAITIFSWRPFFENADPIFLYFRQPGIDTTAAARTAAPVSQTQVEVAIAAADGDLNVAVKILMIQHVNKQRFYVINGENCGI